jgi:hypothetical protein
VIKYVAPLYLIITIGRFAYETLPGWIRGLGENEVARNSVLLVLAVIVLLVTCTAIGTRRWRAAGLDVDGERLPDEDLPQRKG